MSIQIIKSYTMRRLTIHLKEVDKTVHPAPTKENPKGMKTKIHNTVSFNVNNDREIAHHLSMHKDNTSKYYFSNINPRGKYALGKGI